MSFSYDDDDDLSEEDNMDETLSPMERVNKYKDSHLLLQRLRILKEFPAIAQHLGYEKTKSQLLEPLKDFAEDREGVILQTLAEQLIFFSKFFIESDDNGTSLVIDRILPIAYTLLTDEHHQVRGSAADSFYYIVSQLSKEQQEQKIIPIITKLANNQETEDHRIEAAELLKKLAVVFKGNLLVSYGVEKVVFLAKDPMFRVRKVIAACIGTMSDLVPEEIVTSKLVPVFELLSRDEIWGVRKACSESIVSISKASSKMCREEQLTAVFEKLIKDSSRWVRNATYQQLGPFIATLDGDSVPDQLLDQYTSMVEGTRSQYGDSDTVKYCAFSFAGVLLTLGKDKWDVLQTVYFSLTQDLQWKVRRTLSHSLHEVAKILGCDVTESFLLPTFELFLKDLDQVKVGVIRHLSEFLVVLSPAKREEYIDTIRDIQIHGANWRFRKLLAKQLASLAQLFDMEAVVSSIIPMAIQLCEDQVTTVRYAVTKQMGPFLALLKEKDAKVATDFIKTLLPFHSKQDCYDRQMFAMICENIASTSSVSDLFETHFFQPLLSLSKDNIPNVRFVVARIFTGLEKNELFPNIQASVIAARKDLIEDIDREVRFFT